MLEACIHSDCNLAIARATIDRVVSCLRVCDHEIGWSKVTTSKCECKTRGELCSSVVGITSRPSSGAGLGDIKSGISCNKTCRWKGLVVGRV